MSEVIHMGDASVPLLEVLVCSDSNLDLGTPGSYSKARAIYLLACIRTRRAEEALTRILRMANDEKTRGFVICSLAYLNGKDVINATIDRAWYDANTDACEKWWRENGQKKYEASNRRDETNALMQSTQF